MTKKLACGCVVEWSVSNRAANQRTAKAHEAECAAWRCIRDCRRAEAAAKHCSRRTAEPEMTEYGTWRGPGGLECHDDGSPVMFADYGDEETDA